MGMACEIRALTERQIEVLLANPDRVWDVAFGDDEVEDEYEDDETDETDETDEDKDDDEADGNEHEKIEALLGEPLREELYLDKSWHVLHFLLRRAAGRAPRDNSDDSSSDLIFGELIGDEPADYYGPYLRSVEETRQFADFLRSLTLDQLMSHFNWQEMQKAEVYLVWKEVVDAEEERDLREYAGGYFEALREYVVKAAESRCGLLLIVN